MKLLLILEVPDPEKLKVLFDELEFKTVAAKILAEIDKSEKPRNHNNYLFLRKIHFRDLLFGDEAIAPVAEKDINRKC